MKRCFAIGLNYNGDLSGCINDAKNISRLSWSECTTWLDIERSITKTDFLEEFSKQLQRTAPGDVLWFYYAGHGTQQRDYSGDELDYKDECLVFDHNVTDDELSALIKTHLHPRAALRVIIDACHSGTILDLPWHWVSTRRQKYTSLPEYEGLDVVCLSGCSDHQVSREYAYDSTEMDVESGRSSVSNVDTSRSNDKSSVSNVDTSESSRYNKRITEGAMTHVLLQVYKPEMDFIDLMQEMRIGLLKIGFEQIPQLCYTRGELIEENVNL